METSNRNRLKGVSSALSGVIIYATDTLLISLSQASGFVAGFWRGFFSFIIVATFLFLKHGKTLFIELKKSGLAMVVSGCLYGIGGVLYTNSVALSGTSLSLLMLSLCPGLTTIFSAILLKEYPKHITIVVIVICFASVLYMFSQSISNGESIFGFILAFLVPVCLSLNFVNLRKHPNTSRLGVSMIGGLVASFVCICASQGSVGLPIDRLIFLIILGSLVIPLGQVLILTGTKYISASETSLINSLECVIGIIYVWLFIGVIPERRYLIGGSVIIIAIFVDIISELLSSKVNNRKIRSV